MVKNNQRLNLRLDKTLTIRNPYELVAHVIEGCMFLADINTHNR